MSSDQMMLYQTVPTPCIGVCSTGIGDSVCRGCKRFEHEIIHWNSYQKGEKQAIENRLSGMLAEVVSQWFNLTDEDLLLSQLAAQQIRYAKHRGPYCWIHDLLRYGGSQIETVEDYGFTRSKKSEALSLVDIRFEIDQQFYLLAIGHYERYIVANQKRASCVSV